jgi:hypothetical protein
VTIALAAAIVPLVAAGVFELNTPAIVRPSFGIH